jgi:hypothetical protein
MSVDMLKATMLGDSGRESSQDLKAMGSLVRSLKSGFPMGQGIIGLLDYFFGGDRRGCQRQ